MASLSCKNFAAHVHRNFAREVAAGHGGRHFGDVAHLAGQVAGHRVDGVGQVFPRARHAGHLRLSAQFAVGSHFARHARHFRGEHAQLLNHRVHDLRRPQEFAFQRPAVHVQPHCLRQVALRDGGDRARHFRGRPQQIFHQRVDRNFHLAPRARDSWNRVRSRVRPSLPTTWPDALQLLRHLLVGGDDVVECVGDFSGKAGPRSGQANGEIAVAHGLQAGQHQREFAGVVEAVTSVAFCYFGDCRAARRGSG